jgi:tetratricopeptide (TPR) repeat protein
VKLLRHIPASIAILLATIAPLHAFAEKPRGYTAHPIETASAYSQRARDAYAAGTWTVEELEGSTAASDPGHMQRAYESALRAFTEAVAAEPAMYEAHSYLGYVQRKLGHHADALRAYDAALKLKPDYVYAIEYQGEAFLGLGDFTRARFNYLRLYALDQQLAAKLLDAMRAWLKTSAAQGSAEFVAARDWIEAQLAHTH